MKTAERTSEIIGEGQVRVNLDVIISLQAYYAPEFNSKIIASHILSDVFEVHVTSSLRKEKSCLVLRNRSLNIDDVLCESKCLSGLYPIQPSPLPAQALSVSKSTDNSAKRI